MWAKTYCLLFCVVEANKANQKLSCWVSYKHLFFSVARIQNLKPPKPSQKFFFWEIWSNKALRTLIWCWTSNSIGVKKTEAKNTGSWHRNCISKWLGCTDLGIQVKTSYIVPLIQIYHFHISEIYSLESSPYTLSLARKSLYVAAIDLQLHDCSCAIPISLTLRSCSWSHHAAVVVSCTGDVLVNSEGSGADVPCTYPWGSIAMVLQWSNFTWLNTLQYNGLWTLPSLLPVGT